MIEAETIGLIASSLDDTNVLILNNLKLNDYVVDQLDSLLPVQYMDDEVKRCAMQQEGVYVRYHNSEVETEAVRKGDVRVLTEIFERECRETLGVDGFVSDVQVRDMFDDEVSDPFNNFHLDVPVVNGTFLEGFKRRYDIDFELPEKYRKDPSHLVYNLHHRVAASVMDDSDDDYVNHVGGQLNCWWQISTEDECAMPTLAFFEKDISTKLLDAVDKQIGYSDVAVPAVLKEVQKTIRNSDSGLKYCPVAKECALLWNAQEVLHGAVYLSPTEEKPRRRSIEMRFTVLTAEEAELYKEALLDEIKQFL